MCDGIYDVWYFFIRYGGRIEESGGNDDLAVRIAWNVGGDVSWQGMKWVCVCVCVRTQDLSFVTIYTIDYFTVF